MHFHSLQRTNVVTFLKQLADLGRRAAASKAARVTDGECALLISAALLRPPRPVKLWGILCKLFSQNVTSFVTADTQVLFYNTITVDSAFLFIFLPKTHTHCTARAMSAARFPGIFLHVIIINAKRCSMLSRLINATLLDYCWTYFTTSVLCAVLYAQYISLRFSSNACKTAICTFRISAANESLSASKRCARLRLLSSHYALL